MEPIGEAVIALTANPLFQADTVLGTYYLYLNEVKEDIPMPRQVGDRYLCEKCGAQLVYEKPCPCPETMAHSEICCGEQMKLVSTEATVKQS